MDNLFSKARKIKENIGGLFKPDSRPSYEKPFLRRAADLFQPTLVSPIPNDPASRTFKEKLSDIPFPGYRESQAMRKQGEVPPEMFKPTATPTPTQAPMSENKPAIITPVDKLIGGVFGDKAEDAKRILRWVDASGKVKGENTGFMTGQGWDDYNYDKDGKPIYIRNPFTNQPERSEDRGLFRINNATFYDFQRRKKAILERNGISNYQDMYLPDKNIKMAKIIFDEQGWDAWYAAPPDLMKQ